MTLRDPIQPIADDADFLNQIVVSRQLVDTIDRGGSCVILGGKGMGKTSLIWSIRRRYSNQMPVDGELGIGGIYIPILVQLRAHDFLDLRGWAALLIASCLSEVKRWIFQCVPHDSSDIEKELALEFALFHGNHDNSIAGVSFDLRNDLRHVINSVKYYLRDVRLLFLLDDFDSLDSCGILDDCIRVLRPILDHEDLTDNLVLLHRHVRMVLTSSRSIFAQADTMNYLWRTKYQITPIELQVLSSSDLSNHCFQFLCENGYEPDSANNLVDEVYRWVGGHPLLWQTVRYAHENVRVRGDDGAYHISGDLLIELLNQRHEMVRNGILSILRKEQTLHTLLKMLLIAEEGLTTQYLQANLHNCDLFDALRTLRSWGVICKIDDASETRYRISGRFVEYWLSLPTLTNKSFNHIVNLEGSQFKLLHEALISAFTEDGLKQVVRFTLNKSLADIADGENFSAVVFSLIQWAEKNGCLSELIMGTRDQAPKNPKLRQFFDSLQ